MNGQATPKLGLGVESAAAAIEMSRSTFERHVLPQLRVVRVGRRIIIPVPELQKWLDRNAARHLDEVFR